LYLLEFNKKFIGSFSKTITIISHWEIIVTVSITKYKYGSPLVNIKQNNYNDFLEKVIDNHNTEVLSQEEIDRLLTAINGDEDDEN
jgi:hypothetical protein